MQLGRPAIGSGHRSHSYTYVDVDNRGGAREAVRHLMPLGRRRIGTVTGPAQPSLCDRRRRRHGSGALRVLRERGRRVPEDVAVVGFDDLATIAEVTEPPLTTVHQDIEDIEVIEDMRRLAARLLLKRRVGGRPISRRNHRCSAAAAR
ncbi:substrate-binding domain-containing protein [Streptomyces sp. B21-108]|uniref:substrate-binding domain-containing protein n=1 Tax=Streptomyces sp. B21-108 TaxID=3039419 RepID=UPI003FA7579B